MALLRWISGFRRVETVWAQGQGPVRVCERTSRNRAAQSRRRDTGKTARMQIYEFETKQSERQRQRKVEEEQRARKVETREMKARRRHKREMKELEERVQAIRDERQINCDFWWR